jgi:hypothetical protein
VLTLLDSVRPQLPHVPLLVQGEAFLLYGKCYLVRSGGIHPTDLTTAVSYLDKAKTIFFKVQHIVRQMEVCSLLAVVYHRLNAVEKRNDSALQFLDLERLHIQRRQDTLLLDDNSPRDERLLLEAVHYTQ